MKKTFWDKRIPTLLGVFLIIFGLTITTLLANKGTVFQSKASQSQNPQNVRITNVTDNSFTVSYVTKDQILGSINYGKDKTLGQTSLNDKNQQSDSLAQRTIHNFTIKNLSPQTKYYFTILSGEQSYTNNGQPFEATTGVALSKPTEEDLMTGKIILEDGTTPKEAFVYITTDNAQVISTTTKPDGTYTLSLSLLRSADLNSYYHLSPRSILKILVSNDSLTSNAILSKSQSNSVPVITLSKDYDFTESQNPNASNSANLQNFPSFESITSNTSSRANAPEILSPKQDQGFTDQQPSFKGTGLPNETVQIIIHSNTQIQENIKTDPNGNWSYRPASLLDPGTHTITIVTKNASGILKTITQSFVVYAEGTKISGAVPSVTPTATPTLKPTAIPTLKPTAAVNTPTQPTLTPTPTEIIDQFSTETITPTPTIKLLPPSGNASIITAGIVGLIISFIGGLIFLSARGGISAL